MNTRTLMPGHASNPCDAALDLNTPTVCVHTKEGKPSRNNTTAELPIQAAAAATMHFATHATPSKLSTYTTLSTYNTPFKPAVTSQ